MPDDFWDAVDKVSVSMYPGKQLEGAARQAAVRAADDHGVSLELTWFPSVGECYSELGTSDRNLVGRIYRTCQMANVWRCHTVMHGHLYRCPQSAFLRSIVGRPVEGSRPGADRAHLVDALPIEDSPDFVERLLIFLERAEPLDVCANCLGSVGQLFGHSQI